MTTLYRPVRIETVEQAEVLPDVAIVVGDETGERYTKSYNGEWWGITEMAGPLSQDVKYDKIVALVPIEAEEVRAAKAEAWTDACEAFAWCIANGPIEDALPHVAEHNPYRETGGE